LAILSTSTELIADVRSLINEATAAFWSDAFITRQLEKAHQLMSAKLKVVHTLWTATLTSSTPSAGEAQITDNREIRLPSTFISLDDGGVYYNDKVCVFTSLKIIKEADESWLDKTGTPQRYYLRGDMLGFDKQITAGDTVRIYGTKLPTELSASQAPFDGDYRTIGYRSLLVDYAVAMCWKAKNEMTKYAFYMAPKVGSFWIGLEEMKEELIENYDEDYRMIPHENPAHIYQEEVFPDYTLFD